MTYEDHTAETMADAVSDLRYADPADMAGLAALDEATARWAERYPELSEPQKAFAGARDAQWARTRTAETWQTVLTSGTQLAAALRELGDVKLTLCPAHTPRGTCKVALSDDGQCPRAANHVPAPGPVHERLDRWFVFLRARAAEAGASQFISMVGFTYGYALAMLEAGQPELALPKLTWLIHESQPFRHHPDYPGTEDGEPAAAV